MRNCDFSIRLDLLTEKPGRNAGSAAQLARRREVTDEMTETSRPCRTACCEASVQRPRSYRGLLNFDYVHLRSESQADAANDGASGVD